MLSLESKGSVQVSDLDEISALSILPESSVVLGGSLAGEHTVITFDTSYSEVDRIDLPMAPILVGRFVITAQVLDLVQGTILTTLEQQPEAAASDETFLYLAGQSGISRVQ